MKIELIPKGKENKITRKQIMMQSNILNEQQFKEELAELKKKYIILYEDGYYRPDNIKEYQYFINKCNLKKEETQELTERLIDIAKKEMEGLNSEKSR